MSDAKRLGVRENEPAIRPPILDVLDSSKADTPMAFAEV